MIATYEYDSYGKIQSIKDAKGNNITDENHIANKNPFRYRSYYYDKETKLYYLNSRYYNPEWGRFLNADGIIGTSESHLGYNLYAYCENNPIIFKDIEGNFLGAIGTAIANIGKKVIQAVATVVSSAIGVVLNMPVSANMFNKSINRTNPIIDNVTEKVLTTKVKNSSEMKKEINKCISNNKNNNKFVCEGSVAFESSLDLKYSLHKANYIIEGSNNLFLNTTSMHIKVYDNYNFGEGNYPPRSVTDAANRFGTFYEEHGLLTAYPWDIDFFVKLNNN